MNYIDHIVRNNILDGSGAVTLSTGTEEVLYPATNLYNGRPGIPFRSADANLVIDVDLGAATAVKEVFLLATNLENVGGVALNLKACNATPPVTNRGNGSPFGALDVQSDFFGKTFLYPVKWTFAATCRYFRFTISQVDRVADYTQIGEIWIEPSADYSWWDDTDIATRFPSREQWSGRLIEHERHARARAFLRGQGSESRSNMAGAATLLERAYRSAPLVMIDPAGYAGQRRSFTIREEHANNNWKSSELGESIIKTFDGDGKI